MSGLIGGINFYILNIFNYTIYPNEFSSKLKDCSGGFDKQSIHHPEETLMVSFEFHGLSFIVYYG